MVGMGLGNAGGNGADADLGHQLDRYAGLGIDVLEIVDQLRQILDGIDVVVRRRRNQTDAGGRVPDPRDPIIDLVPRQLPALAGFGALGHFNLKVVGVGQVFRGHAETAGGHLFDGGSHGITVFQGLVAF